MNGHHVLTSLFNSQFCPGRRDTAGRRIRAVQEAVRRPLRAEAIRPTPEGHLLGHGVTILQQEAGTHEGSASAIN